MLKELIKIATNLDQKGYEKEASRLDKIIQSNLTELRKLSGFLDKVHIEETPEFAEYEAREEFEAELIRAADAALLLLKVMTKTFSDDQLYDLAETLSEAKHGPVVDALVEYIKENEINLEEDFDSKSKEYHKDEVVTKILTKEDNLDTSAEILKVVKD